MAPEKVQGRGDTAHDEGLARTLRDDLAQESGITERRMFGGLCLMKDGHVIAGVHGKGGLMFRVGKAREAEAMAIDGAGPMEMTGRTMGGFVDVMDPEAIGDSTRRQRWLQLALENAASLPPK